MQCIFCRADSASAKSEEHVIPASLGNEDHVLPPGMVCDACNNYFGRKLEHKVLTSPYFKNLRARQALTSRAGNPLLTKGIVSTGNATFVADFSHLENAIFFEPTSIDRKTKIETAIRRACVARTGGRLYLIHSGEEPELRTLSRFLAKIGLEILAHRFIGNPDFEIVIFDGQLDAVRRWARYGSGTMNWPFHRRRLYHEDHSFTDANGPEDYQVLHEFDLLITEHSEWFAVICIFGEEFAINLGGPEIEGYESWLIRHDNVSPLYTGKNRNSLSA